MNLPIKKGVKMTGLVLAGSALGIWAISALAVTCAPGTNCAAINTNSNGDVTIGSSTVAITRLNIVASTSDSSANAFKILQSNGTAIFTVRNDGITSIKFSDGTTQTTAGSGGGGATSTSAGLVTPGAFNSVAGTGGNYSFPASLSVSTTTAPSGGVLFVNGNVGIGTATPTSLLEVVGASGIRVRAALSDNYLALGVNGSNLGFIQTYTNGGSIANTIINPVGGNVFLAASGGKVGINTTVATSTLTVVGTIESTTGGFKFPDGTTQTSAAGTGNWTATSTGIFYSGGNIGIGTVSPTNLLQVSRDDSQTTWGSITATAGFKNTNQTNNTGVLFALQTNASDGTNRGFARIGGIATNHTAGAVAGDLIFDTMTADSSSEKMRILSSGNVGIGNSSPTGKLDVKATSTFSDDTTAAITVRSGSVTSRVLLLGYDSSAGTGYVQAARESVGGFPLALNPNGGNVGIGTTTPANLFTVNGTATFVSHITAKGGTAPSVSSCGSGPTVATGSTDSLGKVYFGSSSGGACTITYGAAYTNIPTCVVSGSGSMTITTSTKTLLTVQSGSADYFNYTCFGLNE